MAVSISVLVIAIPVAIGVFIFILVFILVIPIFIGMISVVILVGHYNTKTFLAQKRFTQLAPTLRDSPILCKVSERPVGQYRLFHPRPVR